MNFPQGTHQTLCFILLTCTAPGNPFPVKLNEAVLKQLVKGLNIEEVCTRNDVVVVLGS
jgi:hypothetical protein